MSAAPLRASPPPTGFCLRRQLYAKKPANWLEWDQAQAARVKCIAEWNAKKGSLDHTGKMALLKELLVLLFHTVMPPDRVGIGESSPRPLHPATPAFPTHLYSLFAVRKLKWGATLKKDAPGAYRLDMTVARFMLASRTLASTVRGYAHCAARLTLLAAPPSPFAARPVRDERECDDCALPRRVRAAGELRL